VKTRSYLFNTAEIQIIECAMGHAGGMAKLYLRGRKEPITLNREDFDDLVKALLR
jgi:hypothetical protein